MATTIPKENILELIQLIKCLLLESSLIYTIRLRFYEHLYYKIKIMVGDKDNLYCTMYL